MPNDTPYAALPDPATLRCPLVMRLAGGIGFWFCAAVILAEFVLMPAFGSGASASISMAAGIEIIAALGLAALLALPFFWLGQMLMRLLWIGKQAEAWAEYAAARQHSQHVADRLMLHTRLTQLITRLDELPDMADRGELHTAINRLPDLLEVGAPLLARHPEFAPQLLAIEQARHHAQQANDGKRPQLVAQLRQMSSQLCDNLDEMA